MEVTIHYFGMLADAVSKSEETIKTDLRSIAELEEFLVGQYPGLNNLNYSIAKNARICSTNELINEADTIAFLPPFAGG